VLLSFDKNFVQIPFAISDGNDLRPGALPSDLTGLSITIQPALPFTGVKWFAFAFLAGAQRFLVAIEELDIDNAQTKFLRRKGNLRMVVKSISSQTVQIANPLGRMCRVVQFSRVLNKTNGGEAFEPLKSLLRMGSQNGIRVHLEIVKKTVRCLGLTPPTTRFIDARRRVGRKRPQNSSGSIHDSLIPQLNVLKLTINPRRFHAFTSGSMDQK